MQRASLRPVPQRPARPVDPAEALAHVAATLPALDEDAAQALALVELVGRSRPQLVVETGMTTAEAGEALARARKALRRASVPLPGSGWCERAEQLLSHELDGELVDPGPRRLVAHLSNCDRCVEHERRLWQARDQLVAAFDAARAPVAPVEPPPVATGPDHEPLELADPDPPAALEAAPPPELRLVEPVEDPPTEAEVPAPVEQEPAPEPEPAAPEAEVPAPPVEPAPAAPQPAEPAPAEPEPADPEPANPEPVAGIPEPEPVAEIPEPEPAAPEPDAPALALEAPAPPVSDEVVEVLTPDAALTLSGLAWAASYGLAVLLALASLALTIWAIAGGSGL